jgi:hypothetical protein
MIGTDTEDGQLIMPPAGRTRSPSLAAQHVDEVHDAEALPPSR